MSSPQAMLYFQYSSQGKRKLLLAPARDDKNGGAVNNNTEQASGRVTWRTAKSEIRERWQQVWLRGTGSTPGIVQWLWRCDK